jgi:hemolysin D
LALPKVDGRDREFLPAALEILETPPPPASATLMLVICAFAIVALVWSFVGKLDVYAVAQGKIETAGRAKVIQPLEPGKIESINIENGSRVSAGDVLLEINPAEARADTLAQRDALNANQAEVSRRRFAIEIARPAQVPQMLSFGALTPIERAEAGEPVEIGWENDIPEVMRLREEAVLRADLSQLTETLRNIDKQMAQKEATRERLRMSIAFQNNLIDTLTLHLGTRQEAMDLKVGTKINLYDAKEQLAKSQSSLASDQGQLIETDAALKELQSEKAKETSVFIADNQNKLEQAARKADEARQALAKAEARLSRTKLVAPIDGVIQQLAVTTVGQVVATGQQLAVIIPREVPLQVEALVANTDIGFVRSGQDAVVKVDAFPFTRFGVLRGKVLRIAPEAVDERDAKRALANAPAAANAGDSPTSGPGQPESFVFPVTLSLEHSSMLVGDSKVTLTPGMTVTVEIRTDTRRVIDYLLSPLAKLGSEALRER